MPKHDEKAKFQVEFNVILSFAQELREIPLGSGKFLPASNMIADPGIKGTSKLCFSPDFQSLDVELNISGNLSGDHAITLAHIHLDDASKTGPLTVNLYPNDKAIVKTKKD